MLFKLFILLGVGVLAVALRSFQSSFSQKAGAIAILIVSYLLVYFVSDSHVLGAVAAALWSACYCRSIRDCCPAQRSTGPGAGVRGMTIWPDPERCQMKRRRGTGAYFGVAELVFGIA